MDLWDMTKLVFRRWYFSLPILAICGVMVVGTALSVKPDYAATGHVTLVPPSGTTGPDGRPNPIRNPWYELGYQALGDAAMLDVTRKAVIEDLVADGLTDNITVEMNTLTVFSIEAVGSSPEQATATVQRMMRLIQDAVAARQSAMGVASTELIGTLPLDDGTAVETQTSKLTRVLAVAGGAALLVTVASTVGLDALARGRSSRRRQARRGPAAAPAAGAGLPTPPGAAQPPSGPAVAALPAVSPSPMLPTAPDGETPPAGAPDPAPDPASDPASQTVSLPLPQREGGIEDIAPRSPEPEDATIVLPLSGGWLQRTKRADRP